MGVSGCGKSTIGETLASRLSIPFKDGDDFHSDANVEKMSQGKPLTDDDRKLWLEAINSHARNSSTDMVIACSALKKIYREWLSENLNCKFVLLDGYFKLIFERMKSREDHFMPPELLQSQFDTLEITQECIQINIDQSIEQIINDIMSTIGKKEIGIIGMGVMGKNLARNMARNGFSVALYNRRVSGKEEDVALNVSKEFPEFKDASAFEDMTAFVQDLSKPRKILMMVPAGAAVGYVIDELKPLCDEGDVIIDGGNSFFKDTEERYEDLKKIGIGFLGMGVSGGEVGALEGPSIMPACSREAYENVKNILETIAAKNKNGLACCKRIGEGGSGHFVKMVHNGMEYAEMQLIAESYDLLKTSGYSNEKISDLFDIWQNTAGYGSFLLEITVKILRKKDDKGYIVDRILDQASNKGTGKWTSVEGIELGVPFNIISSALYARYISNYKAEREEVGAKFDQKKPSYEVNTDHLKSAYQAARILNHAQGLKYMTTAAEKYKWNLDLSAITQIWTGGCIIQSDLMYDLVDLVKETPDLMESDDILSRIKDHHAALKNICSQAIAVEVPTPTMTACANFLHGMKQARSSANMIQAQRDFFGAHTYKLLDDPEGPSVHTEWQ